MPWPVNVWESMADALWYVFRTISYVVVRFVKSYRALHDFLAHGLLDSVETLYGIHEFIMRVQKE